MLEMMVSARCTWRAAVRMGSCSSLVPDAETLKVTCLHCARFWVLPSEKEECVQCLKKQVQVFGELTSVWLQLWSSENRTR